MKYFIPKIYSSLFLTESLSVFKFPSQCAHWDAQHQTRQGDSALYWEIRIPLLKRQSLGKRNNFKEMRSTEEHSTSFWGFESQFIQCCTRVTRNPFFLRKVITGYRVNSRCRSNAAAAAASKNLKLQAKEIRAPREHQVCVQVFSLPALPIENVASPLSRFLHVHVIFITPLLITLRLLFISY